MNKLIVLPMIAVAIIGCKKDNAPSKSVIGKWELRTIVDNGFAHWVYKYPPGNGSTIQFNADSTFSLYDNLAKTADQGSFHIIKNGYNVPGLGIFDALYFSNNTNMNYIQFRGDTLDIIVPNYQFSGKSYVKQ